MTETEINQKKDEIKNALKGLTYREYRQVIRRLEEEVEKTATIN